MWLKIIGSMIIISTTTLIGISFYLKEKYRKEDFINLDRILRLMKHEISHFKIPLEDVFFQIGKSDGNTIEKIFSSLKNEIEKKEEKTIGDIWNLCWGEYENECYFNKTDMDEIKSFSKTLNNITRENQESNVDFLLDYIYKQQGNIEKRLDKNGKLYYSMGVLTGLFVVVTLA